MWGRAHMETSVPSQLRCESKIAEYSLFFKRHMKCNELQSIKSFKENIYSYTE